MLTSEAMKMVFFLLLGAVAQANGNDDWSRLWVPRPEAVRRGEAADFDGMTYATYISRHFKVLYPTSRSQREADRRLALHSAARLDNLYDFLAERTGVKPATPIRAVLVEGQYGRSRAYPEENAISTGEEGAFPFVLGSFFHELVHLFNFAVPGAEQDFWSGELYAQYHDDRILSLGLEHRERTRQMLGKNAGGFDWGWIKRLDQDFARIPEKEREHLMAGGISVFYYLEDEFGPEKLRCFWRAHLDPAQRRDEELWARCFGLSEAKLKSGWRRYYGL